MVAVAAVSAVPPVVALEIPPEICSAARAPWQEQAPVHPVSVVPEWVVLIWDQWVVRALVVVSVRRLVRSFRHVAIQTPAPHPRCSVHPLRIVAASSTRTLTSNFHIPRSIWKRSGLDGTHGPIPARASHRSVRHGHRPSVRTVPRPLPCVPRQ
uniref:Putative secreted peptide n=1 Tax=Anopheles braziliensis TaxID=58242 RepID=A0A2M3ZRL4_9DIPT